MPGPFPNDAGLVTGSAVLALLFIIISQHLSSRQSELWSEMLSWATLLVVFKVSGQANDDKFPGASSPTHRDSSPASMTLWIVAFSIAILCVFKTEFGVVWFLPALTPLLLSVEQRLSPGLHTSREPDSRFSPFVNTIWGTTLVAAFIIGTLVDWSVRGHVQSLVPVVALLLVYTALTPRTDESRRFSRFFPPINIEDAVVPLSLRVVVVLVMAAGIQSLVFDLPGCDVAATFTLGVAKALSWYFLMQTTRYCSWRIATAMRTYSLVSARDPFMQPSDAQALAHVIASLLSLSQVVHLLPKEARLRPALWLFSLLCLIPYVSNIAAIRNPPSIIHSQEHPVGALMRHAKTDFEHMIQRQSKNYTAARDEYRHRYHVEPPPGFEAWFEFAESHQSRIIDEFDMIHSSIAPLRTLSGKEIREIMRRVQNAPNSELWLCTFSGHRAKIHCTHPYRTFDRHLELLFDTLLGKLPNVIPDVTFLVNHIDEPRVLMTPRPPGDSQGKLYHNVTTFSRQPVWDTITKFCPPRGRRKNVLARPTANTLGLPFVSDLRSSQDLCRHSEYSRMYGLTASPTSFHLIEGLVPVLSTGALSPMGDILYPSPAYIESEFQYNRSHDVAWDKKRNNLYWTGSTTGGFAVGSEWRHYHRQRFVSLAQNLEKREHDYLREQDSNGEVSRVKSSFLNGRLFDVAFTRIFQCERKYCRDQLAYFNVKSWVDKDQALRSRLVFDLDGNGISGRYYKLLASKSAPLKQTLLREWHDERLMPWVHYIPVSQSLEELPELVSYLTSSQNGAGQRGARDVAEQGQDWFFKAFREVDMTIYAYRLLLELARLQDPKRPAGAAEASRG